MAVRLLAAVGALAIMWLLLLGAVAAYDAMGGGMMRGAGDMGDMRGMMAQMMGDQEQRTTGAASGQGQVQISDFRFDPSEMTVTAGTTVAWTNKDGAPHTAISRDGSFDSDRLDNGASFQSTFSAPGSFEYYCKLHPWMVGTIVVH